MIAPRDSVLCCSKMNVDFFFTFRRPSGGIFLDLNLEIPNSLTALSESQCGKNTAPRIWPIYSRLSERMPFLPIADNFQKFTF